MDSKKIRKGISRFSAWAGFNLCSLIIKAIPRSWLYSFAAVIAALGYIIAAKPRRIAVESLNIAFGKEKSAAQIEKIARDCFVLMAKSGAELFFFKDRPELLKKQVRLINKEHLEAALAKGRGIVLVSAHFGNFPFILAKLSLEGYKVDGIMRPMHDSRMEKIFLSVRTRMGVKTIYSQPRKACVEESIRALRNNEILFVPLDQNFGTGGIFVDFFGRKAATATGPVILTQRTGAAVLPCFMVRQQDDTHKLIFEPPLELEKGKTGKEAVVMNTQKLTSIIESYIRRYPAEWGWIHRRWKSQPNRKEV